MVLKTYFMVGIGFDVVTYYQGVTALMLFRASDEVNNGTRHDSKGPPKCFSCVFHNHITFINLS